MNKKFNLVGYIVLIIAITFFDLWSKYFIFNLIDAKIYGQNILHPVVEVFSFFNLIKAWNNGVSFSMFSNLDNARYIFSILNLIIILFLLVLVVKNNDKYQRASLSFIIAGAAGNTIDRIINGAVADFLDFHIAGYHWPAFNVADISIFIGAFLLIFENFFNKKNDKKAN
jgi:signal peptidase II